jgi:Flp pilus assembly protein TadD
LGAAFPRLLQASQRAAEPTFHVTRTIETDHAISFACRSESHFNLGLIYERRDMLAEAEQEMLTSLRLNPEQADARNMLGVIYARQGKTAQASVQWRDLLRDEPSFGPPRTNLIIVAGKQPVPSADKEARMKPPPRVVRPEDWRL